MGLRVFLKKHIDYKFNLLAVVSTGILFLACPCIIKLFPLEFGFENGFFENIQMIVLFIGCFLALRTKSLENKKFFIFVFLILTILMLREINCGRTIFFQVEGVPNSFYSWKEIIPSPYTPIVHWIFGGYIFACGIYFIVNKLYKNLFNFLINYKFPIINFIFMLIGMFWGLYSEKVLHNDLLEEILELVFYVSLCSIIYLYSYNKQEKIDAISK